MTDVKIYFQHKGDRQKTVTYKKGPQIAVGSHLAPAPRMHGALPGKGQVWIPLFLY